MRDWSTFVRGRLRVPDLAPAREARIVREVGSQLEDLYRDAVARGATDAEADALGTGHVADWIRLAEDVRRVDWCHRQPAVDRLVRAIEQRPVSASGGTLMVAHLLRDVRHAVRQRFRAPGFTVVAVLTLALGIGATTTIFSVVDGVLLRSLPYPDSAALVRVHEIVPQYGRFSVAPASFLDWRAQNTVFEWMGADSPASRTFMGGDGPTRIPGVLVSWDLLPTLRTTPAIGRAFTAADDAPGADATVILGHDLWRVRFGGDPGIVGRAMRSDSLDATPAPIMYVPIAQDTFHTRWVVARASGDPGLLAGPVRQVLHGLDPALPAYALSPLAAIVSESVAPQRFSTVLFALFAGVALFLAAVGLYGVVAYTVSRWTREIGLRMAIGAAPGDVLRMIVGGGVKLALVGVLVGIAGALALSRLVSTRLFEVTPSDPVSDVATAGLLLIVATVACYVPARRAMRVDPPVALQVE